MNPSPVIETARIYLTTPKDLTLEQIRALDTDIEVMRYINHGKPRTHQESEHWLNIKLEDYEKNGFGLMPAYLKQDRTCIGWGGLKYLENTSKIELGYRLDKAYWGQGLATEIGLAITEYAKLKLNIKQLIAVTHLENIASQRVLEKCGFHYVSEEFYYNTRVSYFENDL